jgi:hypothetical protein
MVNIVRFSIFQYLPNDMRACPFIHVWKYCQRKLKCLLESFIVLPGKDDEDSDEEGEEEDTSDDEEVEEEQQQQSMKSLPSQEPDPPPATVSKEFLEDLVDPSILSKADFWNQEVNWKLIHELLAGACKNIELKVIRRGSSNFEINQSEAKVAADRVPFGFDLVPVQQYHGQDTTVHAPCAVGADLVPTRGGTNRRGSQEE